jgi:signal transduction histidine kinase
VGSETPAGDDTDRIQSLDREDFRDGVVASTLEPVAGGLALLFGAIAVVQRFAMAPPFPTIMAPYSVTMSVVFAAVYAGIRRWGVPDRRAHAVGTAFVLVVLTGTVLPFALIQDPLQATDLVLVAVGAGAVFVSRRWYLANLAVVAAVFGAFVAANPGYARWPNLGVAVMSGSVLGYVVLSHRSNLLDTVHDLRAQDAQQREALERRMDRIEALREQAERERDRARRYADQLEATNEDLNRFARTVSQELADPVREARRRLASAAGGGGGAGGPVNGVLDDALGGLASLEETVSSLQTYAEVAAHDRDLEPVDLGSILAEAWRRAARRRDAEPSPPELGEMPAVVGDPDLLVRLFAELLDNALRHGEAPVCLSTRDDGGAVLVIVEDSGSGIAPDRTEEIFGLLTSGDDVDRPGMGLALVRRIAERIGGDVALDPDPDGGARFVVTLQGLGRIGSGAEARETGTGRRAGGVRAVGDGGGGSYPSSSGA